jgi:hypothetical protein
MYEHRQIGTNQTTATDWVKKARPQRQPRRIIFFQ